jgi:STE24 endopeptidase
LNSLDFSHADVERAARYHRPRYVALVIDLLLSAGLLVVLQWAWSGPWRLVDGLGWAGAAAGYAALVSLLGGLAGLPVALWRGHVRERRWGFSTQRLAGWLADWAKGEAVSLVLTVALWTGLVGLVRALPSAGPAAAWLV